MQKIDEGDEKDDDDGDDILSFAKKTLEQTDLPDTEDILESVPRAISGKLLSTYKYIKYCVFLPDHSIAKVTLVSRR